MPASTTRLAYCRSTSLCPCISHPTPARVVFRPFCVHRPIISYFLLCFLRPCTYNSLLSPSRTLQILLVTMLCCFSWFFHFYGCQRELIHPLGIILTPHEYKEYLHLTQAAKSASISSVAQISNASACLSHSSGHWILDYGAFDHPFGNKDLFSSLTITSPLPMITLANGSQTMAKGIGSECSLPSIPLLSFMFPIILLIRFLSIS